MKRRIPIFLRMLGAVVLAGLFTSATSTFFAALIVADRQEALLVEETVRATDGLRSAIAGNIALGRAELTAVAFAAERGSMLEIPGLMSGQLLALRCLRDDVEVLAAGVDARASQELTEVTSPPPGELRLHGDEGVLLAVHVGRIEVVGIVRAFPDEPLPPGWTSELTTEAHTGLAGAMGDDAFAGGAIARQTGDTALATAPVAEGLWLEVSAPLAPARAEALAITWEVARWSLISVFPLIVIALLLSRALSTPLRRLAAAVRTGKGGALTLPRLPADEVGELGEAIREMSERLLRDAELIKATAAFDQSVAHARSAEEVIELLEACLRKQVPEIRWWVTQVREGVLLDPPSDLPVPAETIEESLRVRESKAPDWDAEPATADGIRSGLKSIDLGAELTLLSLIAVGTSRATVLGQGPLDDLTSGNGELFCRAAANALRQIELTRAALDNEKLAALGQLAASVAHEVNNPLGYVMANLYMIEENASGPTRELAIEAREGAQRIKRIVQDLSSLSRRSAEAPREDQDLRRVAEDAVKVSRPRHSEIPITVDASADIAIHCEPGRIEQVLTNLVANAMDAAASAGTPAVRVEVRAEGDQAIVDVTDNGEGIDEAVRHRMFLPFVSTKGEEGTGLGLHLCRAFARQHDGDVTVARTGPEGTTVRLTLPVAKGERARIPTADLEDGMHSMRASVLIVDDEAPLMRALTRWIGRYAEVVGVTSPAEALDRMREHRFDVVLCDYQMPDMTGAELGKKAVDEGSIDADRFVIMTGSITEPRGGFRTLFKPLEPRPVAELIREVAFQEGRDGAGGDQASGPDGSGGSST